MDTSLIAWTDGYASFVQYITYYGKDREEVKYHFTNEQKYNFEKYLNNLNEDFLTIEQLIDLNILKNVYDKTFDSRRELLEYIESLNNNMV